MPTTIHSDSEETTTVVTAAESWRVPTDAITSAVEEAVGEIVVGEGTVTITKDGSTLGSFNLNSNSNTTIDVSGPDIDTALDQSSTNPVQNSVIATALDSKVDTSSLATVATSGSYSDLLNAPTIDTVLDTSSTNAVQNSVIATAINRKANTNDLASVATSGKYSDLTGTPTIGNGELNIQKNGTSVGTFSANNTTGATVNITVPTAVSDFSDATDYALSADLVQLESSLATVATTGDYGDLTGVPTIDATISSSSTNAVQNSAIYAALADKADSTDIGAGTLTISRNGTTVATFGANSSTNASADITVPTAVTDLSDASNYYTSAQVDSAISGAVSASLKYKGSCAYANLPTSGQITGDVWNITDDFTMDGEDYTAGTNVAWNGTDWDPLAPAIDLSPYALSADIGNATITVATTSATIGTFTTNQSSAATLTIPAATSSAHGTVIVDTALSSSSTNPISNSAVYSAIGDIETILTTLNSGTGA